MTTCGAGMLSDYRLRKAADQFSQGGLAISLLWRRWRDHEAARTVGPNERMSG